MVELSQNAVSKSSEKTILEPVGYLNKFPTGGIHAGFHPVSSRRFLSSDLDCPLFKALFVLNISSPLSTCKTKAMSTEIPRNWALVYVVRVVRSRVRPVIPIVPSRVGEAFVGSPPVAKPLPVLRPGCLLAGREFLSLLLRRQRNPGLAAGLELRELRRFWTPPRPLVRIDCDSAYDA